MMIRAPLALLSLMAAPVVAKEGNVRYGSKRELKDRKLEGEVPEVDFTERQGACDLNGFSRFPDMGKDNSERLLLREGVIDAIPSSLCGHNNTKNVILVVGDGLGWEMTRAGAIAKRVLDELKALGCDTMTGCPDNAAAMEAFQGRTLDDYYTEGKCDYDSVQL